MHFVGSVYSLIDLERVGDQLEMRLGIEVGGGARSEYRYLPFVNGAPDFERETAPVYFADTTMHGSVQVAGRRPKLLRHVVSGFRSSAGEYYEELTDAGLWISAGLPAAKGLGAGIAPWSKDRLLELRLPAPEERGELGLMLPSFRVVRGTDRSVPTMSRAMTARLTADGFKVASFIGFESGEVAVAGRLKEGGIAVLTWSERLDQPSYAVDATPLADDAELRFLGGRSLTELRLAAGSRVLRLEGKTLALDSTTLDGAFPDVWFGEALVMKREGRCHARVEPRGAWLPLPVHDTDTDVRSCIVGPDGTIWMTEKDSLYASRATPEVFRVTEEQIVERRKKSVLLGGSDDATGAPVWAYPTRTCRKYFIAFDVVTSATAPSDYAALRAALRGRPELSRPELIVLEEQGFRIAGVATPDWEQSASLRDHVKKVAKPNSDDIVCAEPVALRTLPIAR
jgi:hypothetical protein